MPSVCIDLQISKDELLRWYGGEAKVVSAIARDGRRVQFPAKLLQRFVTHSGIQGTFIIEFTQAGQFSDIKRCL